MRTDALSSMLSPTSSFSARGGITRTLESFEAQLRAAGEDRYVKQAEQSAKDLVASVFIQPILAAMSEQPFATGPFAPSAGERRFMPLLNQHLADRLTSAAEFPIVDAVKGQLLRHRAGALGLFTTPERSSVERPVQAT